MRSVVAFLIAGERVLGWRRLLRPRVRPIEDFFKDQVGISGFEKAILALDCADHRSETCFVSVVLELRLSGLYGI